MLFCPEKTNNNNNLCTKKNSSNPNKHYAKSIPLSDPFWWDESLKLIIVMDHECQVVAQSTAYEDRKRLPAPFSLADEIRLKLSSWDYNSSMIITTTVAIKTKHIHAKYSAMAWGEMDGEKKKEGRKLGAVNGKLR